MESIPERRLPGETGSRSRQPVLVIPLCCSVNTFMACTLCGERWCHDHWSNLNYSWTSHYYYKCPVGDIPLAVLGYYKEGHLRLIRAV